MPPAYIRRAFLRTLSLPVAECLPRARDRGHAQRLLAVDLPLPGIPTLDAIVLPPLLSRAPTPRATSDGPFRARPYNGSDARNYPYPWQSYLQM